MFLSVIQVNQVKFRTAFYSFRLQGDHSHISNQFNQSDHFSHGSDKNNIGTSKIVIYQNNIFLLLKKYHDNYVVFNVLKI